MKNKALSFKRESHAPRLFQNNKRMIHEIPEQKSSTTNGTDHQVGKIAEELEEALMLSDKTSQVPKRFK